MSMSAVHPIAEHAGPVPGGAATLWMSGRVQHRRAPALQARSAPSRHRCPGSAPYHLRSRSDRTGLRRQPVPEEPSVRTHPESGCLSDQRDGVMDTQALRDFATLGCGGRLAAASSGTRAAAGNVPDSRATRPHRRSRLIVERGESALSRRFIRCTTRQCSCRLRQSMPRNARSRPARRSKSEVCAKHEYGGASRSIVHRSTAVGGP